MGSYQLYTRKVLQPYNGGARNFNQSGLKFLGITDELELELVRFLCFVFPSTTLCAPHFFFFFWSGVIFALHFFLSSDFLHSTLLFYNFFHLIIFVILKLPFHPLLQFLQLWQTHTQWKNPSRSLYFQQKKTYLLSCLFFPLLSTSIFHLFLYPLCEENATHFFSSRQSFLKAKIKEKKFKTKPKVRT